MNLSLRSMLFSVAVCAASLGVFSTASESDPFLGWMGLLALLVIVCATFASVAEDTWRDPESTFTAAIFGVLGFTAILIVEMLVPIVIRG